MKLKNWVSVLVLVIATLSYFSIFVIDNVVCNVAAIIVELICILILTKYSKFCD